MRQTGNEQSFVFMLVLRHTGERRYPSSHSSRQQALTEPVSHTARRTWIPAFAGMTDGGSGTPVIQFAQAAQIFTRSKVLIDKNLKLRVLRDLRRKRNQGDNAKLLTKSLKTGK